MEQISSALPPAWPEADVVVEPFVGGGMMNLSPVGKGGMTAAELRVLEARMDMLDAVLQDLIDQVRRTQPSGWTDQRQRAVSGLQGIPVFQSPS